MAAVTDGGAPVARAASGPAASAPAASGPAPVVPAPVGPAPVGRPVVDGVVVERPVVEGVGATAWLVPAAVAVVVRPWLWGTAVRQLGALAAPGWWRARPRLPLPAPGYLRFRMVTAYGDPDARPEASDVVSYLAWCRDERRRVRSGERRRRNRPAAQGTGR